ncbi:hypothetical protein LCM10_09425 [Rossellomorea aquimaris]|uniref:hypothetical protein n=1 Tax=Rossellomorea aquimaris TaxID=189382 RepID=UPI001CD5C647|nr:hypothetical protein [Rossellomorea aquimaris]MCA1055207.1 hypothetical protein [Rossellomorea aquimaris]
MYTKSLIFILSKYKIKNNQKKAVIFMIQLLSAVSIILYLLNELFKGMGLSTIISVICLIIVLMTIWKVGRFVRVIGGIFIILGMIMLIQGDAGPREMLLSFGPMLNLLTLFALVPLLALPIKLGNYSDHIQGFISRRVRSSTSLYSLTSGISYFFSIFMNLATLPMTYFSVRPAADGFPLENRERFMSRAITHGFSMPLMWAPVTPIVGIVIDMTGVKWGTMLPYVLPLSVIGLLLDWYTGGYRKRNRTPFRTSSAIDETAATMEGSKGKGAGKLSHILIAILLFNIVISIMEHSLSLSFLIVVSLLVIPFSFAWCLLLGQARTFTTGLVDHYNHHLWKMKDQFFIFLSAGFFISAIEFSGTDHVVNGWITSFKNVVGIEIFVLFIPLIPLALAFIGLHPAVALALLAGTLDPHSLDISPYILTVSMLAGAVSAFLMGPYNATIGLMSTIVKTSSYKVSNWNAVFTISFLCLTMLYLILLQLII